MSQASIIINVSKKSFLHGNGLTGSFLIRAKEEDEEFAILVVYPTPETQDIGDGKRTTHWVKSHPLAMDIVGQRSEMGNLARQGVYLCAAEPDISREFEKARDAEIDFLNENPPETKYRRKKHMMLAYNAADTPDVIVAKVELCKAVVDARERFEESCRKLVKKEEVALARRAMLQEYQRLIAQADVMWASDRFKQDINEVHHHACKELGQERPWCYTPQELVDCPGCTKKMNPDSIICPNCGAQIRREFAEYKKMTRKERFAELYPEREATDLVSTTGKV